MSVVKNENINFDPDKFISEANRERVISAEKQVSRLRLAVILVNSFVYLLLIDKTSTIPSLAYFTIVVANAYSFFYAFYQPFKKHSVYLTSYFSTITDGILITLWLYATGGFHSPFFMVWYISIIAVAYRFNFTTVMTTSFIYAVMHIGLMVYEHDLENHLATISLDVSYIFLIGTMASLIAREITDKAQEVLVMKKLRDDAESAQKAAISSEAKLISIFKNAPGFIYNIDRDYIIKFVNRTLNDLNKEELIGTSILSYICFDYIESLRLELDKAFETGVASGILIQGKGKNTDCAWYQCNIAPVKEHGSINELIMVANDISERIKIENELKESEKSLKKLNADLKEVASVTSHNLSRPILNICALLDLIPQKSLNAYSQKIIKMLYLSADELSQVLDDLKETIYSSKYPIEHEEIELETFLKEILSELSIHYPLDDTEIRFQFSSAPQIKSDRKRLRLILKELLENAFKFKDTERPLKVLISSHTERKTLNLVVRDNGRGMDIEKNINKIFNLFSKLDNTTEGKGIGLYQVKKLLKELGGEIIVQSEVNKYSEFKISLNHNTVITKEESFLSEKQV